MSSYIGMEMSHSPVFSFNRCVASPENFIKNGTYNIRHPKHLRCRSSPDHDHHDGVHFLSREEIHEVSTILLPIKIWAMLKNHHYCFIKILPTNLFQVKRSWNSVIGDETGQHGIDILIEFVFFTLIRISPPPFTIYDL